MLDFISRLRRGEPVPEPVLTPPNFQGAVLPAVDADELGGDSAPDVAEPLNRALVLEYEDGAGEPSTRRVKLLAVFENPKGDVYLKCYCLERRAPRNFRRDRILEAYCGVTGEALEPLEDVFPPTSLQRMGPRKGSRRSAAPTPAALPPDVDLTMTAVRAGLRILMTLARADGRVHSGEEREIRDFITGCLGYGVVDEEGLLMEAFYMAPSFEGFLDDCDGVFQWSADVGLRVLEAAPFVINADGVVHDAEVAVLEDLVAIARANNVDVTIGT